MNWWNILCWRLECPGVFVTNWWSVNCWSVVLTKMNLRNRSEKRAWGSSGEERRRSALECAGTTVKIGGSIQKCFIDGHIVRIGGIFKPIVQTKLSQAKQWRRDKLFFDLFNKKKQHKHSGNPIQRPATQMASIQKYFSLFHPN